MSSVHFDETGRCSDLNRLLNPDDCARLDAEVERKERAYAERQADARAKGRDIRRDAELARKQSDYAQSYGQARGAGADKAAAASKAASDAATAATSATSGVTSIVTDDSGNIDPVKLAIGLGGAAMLGIAYFVFRR